MLSSRAASRLSLQTPLAVLSDVGGLTRTSTGLAEYGESKLLNMLWAEALQARLRAHAPARHVLVTSVHPGAVRTAIWDKADKSVRRWEAGAPSSSLPLPAAPAPSPPPSLLPLLLLQSWLIYLAIEAIKNFMCIPVEQGATSPLFLATAPVAALVPGAMYDVGPQIRRFDLATIKNYSPANAEAAFVALDAAIVAKGGPAFTLA